jgi:6-phosphogluconolactonase/glucosamine-6-phosphate isomerase/deaminase
MERISVSADVINHAGIIIVLASGKTKADVADRVETSSDFISLPAVLAKRGIWLLDN